LSWRVRLRSFNTMRAAAVIFFSFLLPVTSD
jgi:hypothetical protein